MKLNAEQTNELLEMMKEVGGYSQELLLQTTTSVLVGKFAALIIATVILVSVLYLTKLLCNYLDSSQRIEEKEFCYCISTVIIITCAIFIAHSATDIIKCIVSPEWVAVKELLSTIKQ